MTKLQLAIFKFFKHGESVYGIYGSVLKTSTSDENKNDQTVLKTQLQIHVWGLGRFVLATGQPKGVT